MRGCKESSRLASEARERRLTWRERLSLRIHVLLCGLCKTYMRQMAKMFAIARIAGDPEVRYASSVKLSPDAKERIKKKLSES